MTLGGHCSGVPFPLNSKKKSSFMFDKFIICAVSVALHWRNDTFFVIYFVSKSGFEFEISKVHC